MAKQNDRAEQLRNGLENMIKSIAGIGIIPATVQSVDTINQTCDVIDSSDNEIFNVRLKSNIDRVSEALILFPKIGSTVLIKSFGDSSQYVAVKYSELKSVELKIGTSTLSFYDGEIVFNGGGNYGLIKINELTDKLNALVSEVNDIKDVLNSHNHNITPTSETGPPNQPANDATVFDKTDYEDTTITH